MATVITVSAPVTTTTINGGVGTFTLNASISCPNTALAINSYTFSGASTATIPSPSGAQWAIIVPPPANAISLTFKGNSGDVGFGISPSQPSPVPTFASSSGITTFYLTSGGAITGNVQVIFY